MRRVLAFREFRLLWLAQSLSVIGDNIVLVALALFIIDRTGSATDLGLVLAAHGLSLVTFLLIGGVWADRLPRHRVMVITDLARFGLHALLCFLIFSGEVQVWQVVVIEILFGAAEAFSRPAASGLLPQTVPEADIQQATALTGMSNNVAEFAGPALASVLVLGAGRRVGVRAGRPDVPPQRGAAVADLSPPAHGPGAGAARRGASGHLGVGARGLGGGPLAHVGVGDARLLLRSPLLRALALVRARPGGRQEPIRARQRLRHRRGRARGRHDRGLGDRARVEAALSDAHGDDRDPAVAGRVDHVRDRHDAGDRRAGHGRSRASGSRCSTCGG